MRSTPSRFILAVLSSLCFAAAAQAARPEAPIAVSPGSPTRETAEESRCPTFSWSQLAAANTYEVTVYRIELDSEDLEPVIRHELPAFVSSWTPSMENCLERGGRYAWSVRAVGRRGEGVWSAPNLFRVAAREQELCGGAAAGEVAAEPVGAPAGQGSGLPEGTRDLSQSPPDRASAPASAASDPVEPESLALIAEKTGLWVELTDTDVQTVAVGAVVDSTENGAAAVVGRSTGASGFTSGLLGECEVGNSECTGVEGYAAAGTGVWGFSSSGTGVLGQGVPGVEGQSYDGGGYAVQGRAFGPSGGGVYGRADQASGYGGVFINSGGGSLIVADPNVAFWVDPVFRVDASGHVDATSFSGGGSQLTNVTAVAGDSATAFFAEGQIEEERISDEIARVVPCSEGDNRVRWTAGNGHCYILFTTGLSWSAAADVCQDLGGYLATVTSAAEAALLADASFIGAWFGYTDARSEGSWEWTTGEIAVTGQDSIYETWAAGEPNDFGSGEDCMRWLGSGWNDQSCSMTFPYVCERDH